MNDYILKVAEKDGKVNFIDSTGKKIFPIGFFDGYSISKTIFAIDNGTGKYALFNNKNMKLTDYKFDIFKLIPDYNLIICKKNEVRLTKTIIDFNGKTYIKDAEGIVELKKNYFLNGKTSSGIYSFTGLLIKHFNNSKISILRAYGDLWKSPNSLLLKTYSNKVGVLDLEGNLVIDTIYSGIKKIKSGKFIFRKDKKFGIISSDFKEIFTLDENIGIDRDFIITKRVHNKTKHGIIDSLGNLRIKLEYDKISYYPGCEIYFVEKLGLVVMVEKSK